MKKRLSTIIILTLLVTGCGDNLLKSAEEEEPAEDAVLELENNNPDKAIDILEAALANDPGNPKLLSILSYAYAARAGVEPLKLAANMTKTSSDSTDGSDNADSGSDGQLSLLFDVVPAATAAALSDIDRAVEILISEIAAEDRLPGDILKLALFQTASFVMHMKAVDLDGDGEIEIDELAAFSTSSATGILNQLASAQSQLSGSDDETSQAAASALTKYQSQIDAQPGATNEEKLKNYLASMGQ
jgi:hypothetical protein